MSAISGLDADAEPRDMQAGADDGFLQNEFLAEQGGGIGFVEILLLLWVGFSVIDPFCAYPIGPFGRKYSSYYCNGHYRRS